MSGFGTGANKVTFGSNGFGSAGGFGSQAAAPQQTATGGFGAASNFGSQQATPPQAAAAFGSQAPPNGFGSTPAQPVAPAQPAAPAFGSAGGFGSGGFGSAQSTPAAPPAAPPANVPSTGGFGSGGGAFGSAGGFGSQQTSPQQPTGGFGSQQAAAPSAPQSAEKARDEQNGDRPAFGSTGGFGGEQTVEDAKPTDENAADASTLDPAAHHNSRYVPPTRNEDDIFAEDLPARLLYSTAFENDEDVTVENGGTTVKVDVWSELNLFAGLVENISRSGYTRPRKIQAYTIPYILEGKDLKAQAETGSGKSAAFLVPIIHSIALAQQKPKEENGGVKNRPTAIIVEPTRELALQLYEQGRKLANNTNVCVVKAYGEYKYTANAEEILRGCDIICGTPGRLMQFIDEGVIKVDDLKFFVLDEADRLLDRKFKEVIDRMLEFKRFPSQDARQTLLFSATFPPEVDEWARKLLKADFVYVKNKRGNSANLKIKQEFRECPKSEKKDTVVEVLKEELAAARAKDPTATQPRTLVFVRTRRDADVMAVYLCESGFLAATINGDRTQDLREKALREFRSSQIHVLVATDVCARGLDIKELDNVINMDLPDDIHTYVHRIGRTGRLRQGRALSLFDPLEDGKLAEDLVEMLKNDGLPVPEYIANAVGSGGSFGNKPFGKKADGFGNDNDGGFGGTPFGGGFGTPAANGAGDAQPTGGFGSGFN